MKNSDVKLIQQSLAGDQSAFAQLVKKYERSVHALAWRKIGDFHIAEEVTQDTFLQVYKKLGTLKDPHRFEGWLYRIASRQCHAWLRKKRMQTQSLEETDPDLIEKMTYSQYIAEEQMKAATEAQRNIVHKLLARLRESERTVVTLHYFGEMTCEEISRFLGVSASTVKSRLRRARLRLKKAEPMIREALEGFQIRANLTENIMQEISRIEPVVPSGGKPFIPWAIAASTLALVVLALGISHQHLTRFQQPYNFDATSEMTVELIDTPIVLNLTSKPDVRTQIGKSTIPNSGSGFTASMNQSEYVPRFLSAQAKKITLNDENPSQNVLSVLRTPEAEYQDYTVVEIDATAFKDGGVLTVDLWIGSAAAAGAFILFDSNTELATDRMPEVILTAASGIVPGKSGKLTHRFDKGGRFKLGATGNAFSGKGKVNSFLAKISINTKTDD
jgi:RNA polymerase sigma factor (sigma-70 family)